MKCDFCNDMAYMFRMKGSDDGAERTYRCKNCGKLFKTVEVKCDADGYTEEELSDGHKVKNLKSKAAKREARKQSNRTIRYDLRMNQFEADLLEFLSFRTEKSRPRVIREALEIYHGQVMMQVTEEIQTREGLQHHVAKWGH